MWSPSDVMAVWDHCVWTAVQAGMAWIGFVVVMDLVFGGDDAKDK